MKKIIAGICIHITFIVIIYNLGMYYGIFSQFPDDKNLLNWDAKWYYIIMKKGYSFVPFQTCNLAFFPLFPYIWKLTTLSAPLISIFNFIIFLISYYYLLKRFSVSLQLVLFTLSFPSMIFFALPYSESTFFAFSTLIIVGYLKNNKKMTVLGFFMTSITRSISVIFIPAIIITEILSQSTPKVKIKEQLINTLPNILASLSGLLCATLVQGIQTGKWFYYFNIQQFWGRTWILPKFPLTTYDAEKIMGIDAISFCIGIVAIYCCLRWFYAFKLANNREVNNAQAKHIVFSALYISGTTILDTMFTSYEKAATNIWSINRHLLCTPFALVFIFKISEIASKKNNNIPILFLVIFCIYFTGVYRYNDLLVFYVSFFLSLGFLAYSTKYKIFMVPFYVLSTFTQVTFYYGFLQNRWIG